MTQKLIEARSFLFVPADRLARLPTALASGAHAVVVDLEDGVAPQDKLSARAKIAQSWNSLSGTDRARVVLRINPPGTEWYSGDIDLLQDLATQQLAGVVVPKSESVSALRDLSERTSMRSHPIGLLPLMESAEGFAALDLIARAPGVVRLVFGHLDFQVDFGLQCDIDERELDAVRFALVLASRRAGLAAPVDGVTVDLRDNARLALDTQRTRRFGFGGKLCIHPQQVADVNAAFAPSEPERQWAVRVLEKSKSGGAGAFRLDGEMVDAPVVRRARRILHESALARSGPGARA